MEILKDKNISMRTNDDKNWKYAMDIDVVNEDKQALILDNTHSVEAHNDTGITLFADNKEELLNQKAVIDKLNVCNLDVIKENLLYEAQKIVEARSDMMLHAEDVNDLEDTLEWVKEIINGDSTAKTNEEKVMLTWQAIMTLFDYVH